MNHTREPQHPPGPPADGYAPPAITPLHPPTAAQLYAQVPFYRKNSIVSALLLFGLVFGIIGPMTAGALAVWGATASPVMVGAVSGLPLWIACGITLTGPVYYKALVEAGKLKTWSVANKIAAVIFLVIGLYLAVGRVL